MAQRKSFIHFVGFSIAILLASVSIGPSVVHAQASGQTLTINALLCPDGYTGTDYSNDCTAPAAGSSFRGAGAADYVVDDSGSVSIDISDVTPGAINIIQNVNAAAGPKVSCVSDGESLAISFVSSGASWAPVRFTVPSKADVVCDLYYSNDISFGIGNPNAAPASANSDNAIQLPDTGAGTPVVDSLPDAAQMRMPASIARPNAERSRPLGILDPSERLMIQ